MNIKKIILSLLPFFGSATAQNLIKPDSSLTLQNIIVNAYENNRKLIDVPAAVSLVVKADLNRYNNTSILSAMNNNPGVRMEERSPGSYRLSIRGSSLTSPFGVRNVKVYYDGIPYTDPSGNTYLNQLGFYNFQSIEVIKGPAGSIYGAGTGGVLLIRNDANLFHPGISLSYNSGSYNLNNVNANIRLGNDSTHSTINYQHQTSDGYRNHTAMHRDVITWDVVSKPNYKSELRVHFLYADLYYQTPGALTLKEYNMNGKSARPAAGGFPSAAQAKAAFYQKTFLSAFSYENNFNENFKNTTSIYGAYTQTRNPSFRNYGRTTEPHFGGRTVFEFDKKLQSALLTLNAGAEFQQNYTTQRIYNNKNGQTDSLQTDDEIYNNQGFIFVQANVELATGWIFTTGASINQYRLNFSRLSTVPPVNDNRKFNNEITPRFAILKKLNPFVSVYGSIARGFSPPTTAEILPSTNVFNTSLQAEKGLDYEFGARGNLFAGKLYFDINTFFFGIKNSIVQRQNTNGADYFVNAGSGKENGLESYISYEISNNANAFINHAVLHASDTWDNFHYKNFKQLAADYSGNKIPGVAAQTLAAGFDVSTKAGLYANTNFFYSGPIALNDANSSYASSYGLLGLRLGFKTSATRKITWELFTGVENILNEKYSLGNDINAAAGRYYNLAPGTNYYAGIIFQFNRY